MRALFMSARLHKFTNAKQDFYDDKMTSLIRLMNEINSEQMNDAEENYLKRTKLLLSDYFLSSFLQMNFHSSAATGVIDRRLPFCSTTISASSGV